MVFKVEVADDGQVSMARLPEVDYRELVRHYDEAVSHMQDQSVLLFCKDNFDPKLAGWDDCSRQEALELCRSNSGIESEHFIVIEWVGRDGHSTNNAPDLALDGFLQLELITALQLLDNDLDLLHQLKNRN